MTVPRTVIHNPLGALLLVCLLAAALTAAFDQNDEDLTFDDEGVVRTRPKVEVAPVAAPLQDSSTTSTHKRIRRQHNIPYSYDDEDAEGSAIEGSGTEQQHIYRVKMQVLRPWSLQYADKTSATYTTLQRNIRSAMEVILRAVHGQTDVKVVDMRKSASNNIMVTIDIANEWASDQKAFIERLVKDTVDSQVLGAIPVSSQDFIFFEPGAPTIQPECRADQWKCPSGRCVGHCDGNTECLDGSDEYGCQVECGENFFECDNRTQCIPIASVCDGNQDCTDNKDEANCTPIEVTCRSDEFKCNSGECIEHFRRCDSATDCRDGEDEVACQCSTGQFTCDSGECIDITYRCDGLLQCRDQSDENGCPCNPILEWQCDYGQCIDRRLRCDGKQDCQTDNSDERKCQDPCRPDQFRCDDGQCLDISQRCNGYEECISGEDEHGCQCRADEFRCLLDGQCISIQKRCDRRSDCSDGSDEHGCPCLQDEWRCLDGQCIPYNYHCDGNSDCIDKSDETFSCFTSTSPPVSSCSSDEFNCRSGECIRRSYVCDGVPDCIDGSDEAVTECAPSYPNPCSSNQFACTNGDCVDMAKRCDRNFDCIDNSDELGCPPGPDRETCRDNEFRCSDGACIEMNWRCDSVPDCSDASDENDCSCKSTEFRCGDGSCILESNRCDGTYDCSDGSDERTNCDISGCRQDEFQCNNGDCIPFSQRCNLNPDCGDRSDEQNCREFICSDGRYIDDSKRCDGRTDCSDGSDEAQCDTGYLSLRTYPDDQTIQQSKSQYFSTHLSIPTNTPSSPILSPSSEVSVLISLSPLRLPFTLLTVVLVMLLSTN